MLESLFAAADAPQRPGGPGAAGGAIPLLQDLLVDDGALASLRDQVVQPPALTEGGGEAPWSGRNITLLDPTGLAAGAVLQVLARASGQPVQQLQLRQRGSLRTLAVVSRSLLRRPHQAPLQVLSTRVHEPVGLAQDFAQALAERADLAVVFVGHLPAPALAVLRAQLLAATARPGWRCPCLLFVLPVQRRGLQADLRQAAWPPGLTVDVLVDHLGQPLALWNRIVERWQARSAASQPTEPRRAEPSLPATGPGDARGAAALASDRPAANQGRAQPPGSRMATMAAGLTDDLNLGDALAERCQPLLARLVRTDGVLACALIDLDSARPLATERAPTGPRADQIDALARGLCAARSAHLAVTGDPPLPDEVLITTGERQALLRRLPGPRRWGFLALADRGRVNLALLRFSLQDLERQLQGP